MMQAVPIELHATTGIGSEKEKSRRSRSLGDATLIDSPHQGQQGNHRVHSLQTAPVPQLDGGMQVCSFAIPNCVIASGSP